VSDGSNFAAAARLLGVGHDGIVAAMLLEAVTRERPVVPLPAPCFERQGA